MLFAQDDENEDFARDIDNYKKSKKSSQLHPDGHGILVTNKRKQAALERLAEEDTDSLKTD
jgi:hypothetical protein